MDRPLTAGQAADPLAEDLKEDLRIVEAYEKAKEAHGKSLCNGHYSQHTALASFEATSALYERMTPRFPVVTRELARLKEENERYRRHLWCLVRNAKHACIDDRGVVLWSVVSYLAGTGSTSAIELCEEFGVDPHELTATKENADA